VIRSLLRGGIAVGENSCSSFFLLLFLLIKFLFVVTFFTLGAHFLHHQGYFFHLTEGEQMINTGSFLLFPANQFQFFQLPDLFADRPFACAGNSGYRPVTGETALGLRIGEGGQDVVNGNAGRLERPAMGKQECAADPIPVASVQIPYSVFSIVVFHMDED
jgi:hypothetical protein